MDGYRLRSAHGDTIDPRQPLPVDSVEAQETSSVAPTLTYNGKAAAGAISVSSLPLKPVIENLGSRVGSYWGERQNMVYSAFADGNPKKGDNWLKTVTETNGGAAIIVYDPNKNLEEMFESVTTTVKRFVVKVYDKDGGTLYGWVMGVAAASGVYTFDIFNNRLTEGAQNWVGTLSSFDNTALDKVEIYFYNSSLAFGTGTCFTEEVECPKEYSKNREQQLAYAEGLSNGQYFVDYMRGELIGARADNTASEAVTYNVWASTAGGSAGPSSNVNVAKVAGTATSTNTGDSDAGTQRIAIASDQLGQIGGSVPSGDTSYSTDHSNFTAAVTDATNDIVLSVDSLEGKSITADQFANAKLKVYDATTEEMVSISLDDFTWTSATKTIDTTNCTGTFTFATGDLVSLTIPGPRIQDNRGADAKKVVEQAPFYTHNIRDTLAEVTNETNATNNYYLDVSGYDELYFDFEGVAGTDTITLTLEASAQDDGTVDSSCSYTDISQYGISPTTQAAGAASYTADLSGKIDCKGKKYIKFKTVSSGGSNDGDYNLRVGRAY